MVFVGTLLAALALAPSSFGEPVFALAYLGGPTYVLEEFSSTTPGITVLVPIVGVLPGDVLRAIDVRPATGQLYAISSLGFTYVINTTTGVATPQPPGVVTMTGSSFGIDVSPVADVIRVVSDADMNVRVNPANGTPIATDNTLTYAAGDPNFGLNPTVAALGYSNNIAGVLTTTAYGIDSNTNTLVRLGGIDGTPSPNTGLLSTVGPLGVVTSTPVGLDISPSGTAYALLHPPGDTGSFYTVNLASGAATLVGKIGGPALVLDIAVAAGPPTAVRIQSSSAVRTARGVTVRWRTGSSAGTLGFNVYREQRGRRVRLNRNLIPAGSSVAGRSYSFLDKKPLRGSGRYWIQAVGSDGSRTWFGPAVARRAP
jgi:hypothetical protein